MITESQTTIAYARARVEQVDRRHRASLATRPVLDGAATLLHAWCATAVGHGAEMVGYMGAEWVGRLAGVALEVATEEVRGTGPATPEEATALLDAVAARLCQRGIATSREDLYVPLRRTHTTPAWGVFGRLPVAVTVDVERGWQMVIDEPVSRVVELVGRCDEAGIGEMLDLAIAVNGGVYGNVFRGV